MGQAKDPRHRVQGGLDVERTDLAAPGGGGDFQGALEQAVDGAWDALEFDRAKGFRGGLAGDLLNRLEMDEVLAELFGGHLIRRLTVMVAELDDTGVVSFLGAGAQRQQREVIGEGV